MLRLFRHVDVPYQAAGDAVQGDEVGVVHGHENVVAENGDSAIGSERRVSDESGRARARILPDDAAGESVQRQRLVRAGDVHDAVGDNRGHFQAEVIDGKNPFHRQLVDVRLIDLVELAVAVAVEGSVVGEPVAGPRVLNAGEVDWRNGRRLADGGVGGSLRHAGEAAEIGHQVPQFFGAGLQGPHERPLLIMDGCDLFFSQHVKAAFEVLQLKVVIGSASGEAAQAASILQLGGDQFVTRSDAGPGTEQHLFDLAHGHFPRHVG